MTRSQYFLPTLHRMVHPLLVNEPSILKMRLGTHVNNLQLKLPGRNFVPLFFPLRHILRMLQPCHLAEVGFVDVGDEAGNLV